jgi:hypothetical protein
MTPEQQDWLRCYIEDVLTQGEYHGDCLHELGQTGISPMLHALIGVIGWLLAMIGRF